MHSSWKPRGGPWGFRQILLRGVVGVARKSRGSGPLLSCFITFLLPSFSKFATFHYTSSPVCVYDDNQNTFLK